MAAARRFDLLIAGGIDDSNLRRLVEVATRRGLAVCPILHEAEREPGITWDFATGELRLDGAMIAPRAAFLRYDVFTVRPGAGQTGLDRALAWYSAIAGWCLAHPEVRQFNRRLGQESSHKSYVLALARSLGLPVPETIVSNEQPSLDGFAATASRVVKPVAGGAYCVALEEGVGLTDWRDGRAPLPAFAQEKLVYPEYRVYLVGKRFVVFEIRAEGLDYRAERSSEIAPVEEGRIDPEIRAGLARLAAELGIDFCAFDLKTRATGGLCFLEVNTGPMFAGFDATAGGALSAAMLDALLAD